MDDSHTNFLPPWLTLEPKFGFKAKPYGEIVRVYDIKKDSPAAKAGLRLGGHHSRHRWVKANRRSYLETQFYYRFIQPAGLMVLDLQREGKPERITIKADVHMRKATDTVYDFSRGFRLDSRGRD